MGGRGSTYTQMSERERAEGVLKAMRDAGMKPVKSVEETIEILNDYDRKQSKGLSDHVNISQYNNYERQFLQDANQYTKKGYEKGKKEILKQVANNPNGIKAYTESKIREYDRKISSIEKSMHKPGITESEYQKKYKQQHELFGKRNAIRNVNITLKNN